MDDILGTREQQLERLIEQERAEASLVKSMVRKHLREAIRDSANREYYVRQALRVVGE